MKETGLPNQLNARISIDISYLGRIYENYMGTIDAN